MFLGLAQNPSSRGIYLADADMRGENVEVRHNSIEVVEEIIVVEYHIRTRLISEFSGHEENKTFLLI